jgi:PAS domain S-box-containing protein
MQHGRPDDHESEDHSSNPEQGFPAALVRRANILVVDDFDDGRVMVSTLLRMAGFAVTEAATGAQALALATAHPDLMILDVHLPDIDGFEVCRRLKSETATATIPVIHLSGMHRESVDRVRGLEGGADAYLMHPVSPEELIASVNSVLRIHRAESEMRESQARYQRLVETALEGVWTLDAKARTTYVNPQMAMLMGRRVEDMLGQPLAVFLQGEAQREAEQRFERAAQGHKEQFDLRFRRADESDLWAIVSTHPIINGEVFTAVLLLVTDITDRKRAEAAERETEALRSVTLLAAAASHEINNPLMGVIGNLDLLSKEPGLDAPAQLYLRRALAAAAEIKLKVWRLAQITRLEVAEGPATLPPILDLWRSSRNEEEP